MSLNRVTITGADDTVNHFRLFDLSEQYPFVEWGILIRSDLGDLGAYRYPSVKWITTLLELIQDKPHVQLSLHLCGKWVRGLFEEKDSPLIALGGLPREIADLTCRFSRVQANIGGLDIRRWDDSGTPFKNFCKSISTLQHSGHRVIFQQNGTSNLLIYLRETGIFTNVLFDSSGGRGFGPQDWPHSISGTYCGYAGGLTPENVEEQLRLIQAVVFGSDPFWIDTESGVRSDQGTYFDLQKAAKFLEIAKPYVEGEV